jgi:anhydro-N-acetylmuramic acid kinase
LLIKLGISAKTVRAIGCHGQTVRHRPESGYTLQLGSPAWLAERTGVTVVADFAAAISPLAGKVPRLSPPFIQPGSAARAAIASSSTWAVWPI